MATEGVTQLLYMLDGAFAGKEWHSLVRNLGSVTPDDWEWVPPEGRRSIREIVHHVGACKFMYHNHAFGDGSLTWDDPSIASPAALATIESASAWLQEGHALLHESLAGLADDAELVRPRLTNWGQWQETRWIIMVMIQHDLYHAGEINHLRCLHQGNDE